MAIYLQARCQETKSGCWLWQKQKDKDGYGQFRKHAKDRWHKSHREMWLAIKGPIPDGFGVLHTCDVPSCINPAHLYLGTQKDNVRDMRSRGRAKDTGSPKTHCKRGHLLITGEACKPCHAQRQRSYREKNHSLVC